MSLNAQSNAYDRDVPDEFSAEANGAIEALLDWLKYPPSDKALMEMLKLSQRTLQLCAEHGLHSAIFANRMGFEISARELDASHLAEYSDAACDAAVCRAARGLPPLTRDEIEAGRRERQENERRRQERIRRAIRKPGRNGRGT